MNEKKQSATGKKWRLFHAEDFTSLMLPSYTLCRYHGLFPFGILPSGELVTSKAGYAYSTFTLVIYLSYLGWLMYRTDVTHEVPYSTMPGIFQAHCYSLLGSMAWIITYCSNPWRIDVFRQISSVSANLPKSTFAELSIVVHAKDLLGYLFLFGQVFTFTHNRGMIFFDKIFGLYTTLIVYLASTIYINCVFTIKCCYKHINETLLNIREAMVNDAPHLLRRVYHERKNPLIVMELKMLKNCHQQLSDLVEQLNNNYTFQLADSVTLAFTEITLSLYFYILQLYGKKGIDSEKQIWYNYYITSIAYYSAKMLLLVWVCETGTMEATKTGGIVHSIMINSLDNQIQEEVTVVVRHIIPLHLIIIILSIFIFRQNNFHCNCCIGETCLQQNFSPSMRLCWQKCISTFTNFFHSQNKEKFIMNAFIKFADCRWGHNIYSHSNSVFDVNWI